MYLPRTVYNIENYTQILLTNISYVLCGAQVSAYKLIVHSPVPSQGPSESDSARFGHEGLSNGPSGARLTLRNPGVYFVAELLLS